MTFQINVGQRVEVRYPEGWRGGYTVISLPSAVDMEYRVDVQHDNGAKVMGCSPSCVRDACAPLSLAAKAKGE